MGISTYIKAIKPADDDWRKMKAIWDACEAAGINPPSEVSDYFCDGKPNDKGVEISLDFNRYEENDKRNHPAVSRTTDVGCEFWDVELAKLPPDVKIIRFVNSW